MARTKWGFLVLLLGSVAGGLWLQFSGGRPAYAQQGAAATGSVTGRVTDASGAVFQGAEVSLQDKRGGAPLSTTSNEDGYYRFPFVGPGEYTLTAKKSGFSDVVIPNLEVQVQRTATVDIAMSPGKVVQEINVSAAAVALQSQTSTLSGVVDSRTEVALPLPMRDPSQLINLVAGVTNDNRGYLTGTTGNAGGLSYQGRLSFSMNGGGRSTANSMVDGVNVTIDAGDFSSVPIVPTPDFTQEFTAQTNVQPAQFGRGEGVLNIVTRSGTNQFHGAAFEFLQNNVLNATNLFTNKAHGTNPHLERNQYGAALGGPVIIPHVYDGRNKTFWFFNLERMKQLAATSITQRVPTAQELNGDFSNDYTTSGVLVPIYNPYNATVNGKTVTRAQFPGNIITPSTLVQQYAQTLGKFYPLPNNPGILGTGGKNTGTGNYTVTGSAPVDWNRMDAKIDEDLNANNRIMFRFSNSLYYAHPVDFYHNIANSYGLSSRNNPQHGMNIVTSWTWTASPTFVVSQAINVSRFTDQSIVPLYNPTSLGGPFADGSIANYQNKYSGGATFPTITPSGYAGLGAGTPYNEPFSNYSYQINTVKTRGKHTFNAGFEFEYLEGAADFIRGFPLALNYTGGFTNGPNPLNAAANTGNGFADMLLGLPANTSNLTAGSSNYLISKYAAWYLQDDIRVTPKLTANLGVRYDFMTPAIARHDIKFMFDPLTPNPLGNAVGPNTGGKSLDQFISGLGSGPLQGAIVFPNSAQSEGRGIVPVDYHDLAPRIGFAYSATPKMVFRGGIARLYSLSPVAPGAFSNAGGPFSAVTNVVAQTNGYTPVVSPTNYFPNGLNVSTGNSLGALTLLGNSVGAGSTTTRVTPYYNQWNIGLERELPGNMTLGVAYAGSEGHRLICPHSGCNSDQIPPGLLAQTGSNVTNVVPNPFFGIITNPTLALSQPTVVEGQLLKQWSAYSNVSYSNIGITQGLQSNHDTFHSSFNALEVQFNKHFSQGLSLVAAFTWSKTLANSDAMDSGYLGPSVSYQQQVNYQAEYSMTADDVPKRLVLGHVYELPVGKGKAIGSNWNGTLDKVLGHWQFSGLTTFQSGYPMAITETGHTTGAQGGSDRPNVLGSPTAACVDGASRSARLNPGGSLNSSAFQTATPFYFGNSARTLPCLRDGIKNLDWSILKIIPIKESFNLEFRSEFFNLTNRPQLGAPNTTFNNSGFGQVTTQFNSPRVIQFGLKLKW